MATLRELEIEPIKERISLSVKLERVLNLRNAVCEKLHALDTSDVLKLRKVYNLYLVRHRQVVIDVPDALWQIDLLNSITAVLFAREEVTKTATDGADVSKLMRNATDEAEEFWFKFAMQNRRNPVMVAMPSLPAINFGENEARYYVAGVSDTWPEKEVSEVRGDSIIVSSKASRHFVNGTVIGDLGGTKIQIGAHEISYIAGCTIGWITRYEDDGKEVTIIEVDPKIDKAIDVDNQFRLNSYEIVGTEEQRLDMYTSLEKTLHSEVHFTDNMMLSRLLIYDVSHNRIDFSQDVFDAREYIHVEGSGRGDLGPLDEEVFLRCLGSISAKNKVRSALAIATKARLTAFMKRNSLLKSVPVVNFTPEQLSASMMYANRSGICIKTPVPFDTICVVTVGLIFTVFILVLVISSKDYQVLPSALGWSLVITIVSSLMYHHLRYNGWPIAEAVRLQRLCTSDEEMNLHLPFSNTLSVIAKAGANGGLFDGLNTVAISPISGGVFSITRRLQLADAERVGLRLRISTGLDPIWIDYTGSRRVMQIGRHCVPTEGYRKTKPLSITLSEAETVGYSVLSLYDRKNTSGRSDQ